MENRNNMIPDEQLNTVSGGVTGSVTASDGRMYLATDANSAWCTDFQCKRCFGSYKDHRPYCQLPEKYKSVCDGCYYFEKLNVDGSGCCRKICYSNNNMG